MGTVILSSPKTEVYNPKTFFPHAASLHQGSPHCAISPTAASRRSLGRVSVPMWPFNLSVRLLIVDLVSRYLTNYLISREPILQRIPPFISLPCGINMSCGIIGRFQPLSPSVSQVAHVLLTRPPLKYINSIPKYFFDIPPFDLHVLGAPPAFVLSQDQTLCLILTALFWLLCSSLTSVCFPYLLSCPSRQGFASLYCLIFKVLRRFIVQRLYYYITSPSLCQHLFSIFFLFFYFIEHIVL